MSCDRVLAVQQLSGLTLSLSSDRPHYASYVAPIKRTQTLTGSQSPPSLIHPISTSTFGRHVPLHLGVPATLVLRRRQQERPLHPPRLLSREEVDRLAHGPPASPQTYNSLYSYKAGTTTSCSIVARNPSSETTIALVTEEDVRRRDDKYTTKLGNCVRARSFEHLWNASNVLASCLKLAVAFWLPSHAVLAVRARDWVCNSLKVCRRSSDNPSSRVLGLMQCDR